MKTEIIKRLKENPRLQELIEKRERFAWTLAIVMLVVYYAFILTIAFSPLTLGTPLDEGMVTTIGIPVGISIIIIAFALTGIYVNRANREFDQITRELKESIKDLE
ncbi:DUF485 domain-containing protein [Nitrosophilus alvini]|uniref:DUF485 domain-containing protein n=1 Tax=Nitrosophilus alvini TaxID=2714855 RepID=UPI00190B2071|nr:DUF485 domain-containing protein [Nitrosophilus alvini]